MRKMCESEIITWAALDATIYTFFHPEVVLRREERHYVYEWGPEQSRRKQTYSHLLKSITINKIVQPFLSSLVLLETFFDFFFALLSFLLFHFLRRKKIDFIDCALYMWIPLYKQKLLQKNFFSLVNWEIQISMSILFLDCIQTIRVQITPDLRMSPTREHKSYI